MESTESLVFAFTVFGVIALDFLASLSAISCITPVMSGTACGLVAAAIFILSTSDLTKAAEMALFGFSGLVPILWWTLILRGKKGQGLISYLVVHNDASPKEWSTYVHDNRKRLLYTAVAATAGIPIIYFSLILTKLPRASSVSVPLAVILCIIGIPLLWNEFYSRAVLRKREDNGKRLFDFLVLLPIASSILAAIDSLPDREHLHEWGFPIIMAAASLVFFKFRSRFNYSSSHHDQRSAY